MNLKQTPVNFALFLFIMGVNIPKKNIVERLYSHDYKLAALQQVDLLTLTQQVMRRKALKSLN